MIRFFVTGDNHIGRNYDRYPDAKAKLISSRINGIADMVEKAEEEACDFFVITGDLFDKINTIKVSDVKKVVEILASFKERVLVLPGNHDYYSGEDKVWKDFEKALSDCDHNITVLNEFRQYVFEDVQGKTVVFYPAFCQSKHSPTNNLDWIKNTAIDKDAVNIGIAHGAIKGITPDMKEEYFLMTLDELNRIPVDAWLIGHTHIPYPADLSEDSEIKGYKVFNPGTHEQTDLHNNTEGNCFIVGVDKNGTETAVYAKRFISGKIRYYDLTVEVRPDSETALEDALRNAVTGINENSVVRVKLSGVVKQNEYLNKSSICDSVLSAFLAFEFDDKELSEEITIDKIRSEFAETSFAAQFMEELMSDHTELQMAYDLLQECKD